MKKIIGVIAFMLLVVSCGKETVVVMQPPETDAPVQEYKSYGNGSMYEEEMFIQFVESEVGSLYGLDLALLVDTGYMICDNLRNGATIDDMIAMIMEASSDGSSDQFLVAVTGGSILFLCPDQKYKLDAISS